MTRRVRVPAAIIAVAALWGCSAPDWLGPLGSDSVDPGLRRVLISAEDAPGDQSLLYTAIVEAEAAEQGAGLGLAAADRPLEAKSAVGEVLYAIDPALAPDWSAKRSGIVQGWRGRGYGVRHAVDGMIRHLQELGPGYGDAPAHALQCLDNTRRRADDLTRLAERALEIDDPERLAPLLRQIDELAPQLNEGRDADGDGEIAIREGECGLQQARTVLAPLRYRARAS